MAFRSPLAGPSPGERCAHLVWLLVLVSGCSGGEMALPPRCGDGQVEAAEACDDGNDDEGDGCSSACTVEADFACAGRAPSLCTAVACGDGVLDEGEQCDDGNTANGDGCTDRCVVTRGFTCVGAPSGCAPTCGDGQRLGSEACDDGELYAGDGCSATCDLEPGFDCPDQGGACVEVCGDRLVVGRETCDDGNTRPSDGCSPSCSATSGWTPLATGSEPPSARFGASVVWTGSRMLVWGGALRDASPPEVLNEGVSYDPRLDAWLPIAPTTLSTRFYHTATWTGTEMIVFGGVASAVQNGVATDVGAYDPVRNRWRILSNVGAPELGYGATAIWTGAELIVFGFDGGGRYDPATDTWRALPTEGAPSPRANHTAVWTGREMIVFGGTGSEGDLDDGATYDPETDAWTAISRLGARARERHAAIWTPNGMLVVGGGFEPVPAQLYDPILDSWRETNGSPRFSNYDWPTMVWTGSEAIVCFDQCSRIARYAPAVDAWAELSSDGAPNMLAPHGVWTGSEMIVWGEPMGDRPSWARFVFESNAWRSVSTESMPPAAPRAFHSAVWTGSKLLLLGGRSSHDDASYDPEQARWSRISSMDGPSRFRERATVVWTGSEAIIFGGFQFGSLVPGGASYEPVGDRWTSLPWTIPRGFHTAVWTGREMIVWGGHINPTEVLGDGAAFDPTTGVWTPLPTTGAPSPRFGHSAVWTGSEMLVFGGVGVANFRGGRYQPEAGRWSELSEVGAPSLRARHTSVWTEHEMIVFGGFAVGPDGALRQEPLADGGRFDPIANTWRPLSSVDAPEARGDHTAVWTGREMIIWGGARSEAASSSALLGDGARYDAERDVWTRMELESAPTPRRGHSATWTGKGMIVFGGEDDLVLGDAALYGL